MILDPLQLLLSYNEESNYIALREMMELENIILSEYARFKKPNITCFFSSYVEQ